MLSSMLGSLRTQEPNVSWSIVSYRDDMTIPENHENIKKFCNADNKEKKYLTNQMIDNRFYKISDIITDVPVEHIEK